LASLLIFVSEIFFFNNFARTLSLVSCDAGHRYFLVGGPKGPRRASFAVPPPLPKTGLHPIPSDPVPSYPDSFLRHRDFEDYDNAIHSPRAFRTAQHRARAVRHSTTDPVDALITFASDEPLDGSSCSASSAGSFKSTVARTCRSRLWRPSSNRGRRRLRFVYSRPPPRVIGLRQLSPTFISRRPASRHE